MKVTGYKLQQKLKELEQTREVLASQFSENMTQFESDTEKVDLLEVFAKYTATEKQIAELQEAQTQYNLGVSVNVLGESMTLQGAVKRVGGAGRSEKMWKDMVKKGETPRYMVSTERSRNKDSEYARRALSVTEALEHARHASKVAGALREAIQTGNVTELELNIDTSLLS